MFRTSFIAITGSVGKTTGKECLAAMLSTRANTFRTPASKNTAREVADAILQVRPWHRYAVIEVGAFSPGWVRRTGGLVHPHVAVILSVAGVHTNQLGTVDAIAREKASLLECLTRKGTAILNGDDPLVAAMRPPAGCRTVFFRASDATNVEASWPQRLSFTFQGRSLRTRLVGRHWLNSVLGALHAAEACGVSFEGDLNVEPALARMQPVELPCGATVIRDDSNGSAPTLEASLEVMASAHAARKILVISSVYDLVEKSMGPRAEWLGRRVAGLFDQIVFVGVKPNRARRAAIEAGQPQNSVHSTKHIEQAVQLLREMLRPGDLVLLSGCDSIRVVRVLHHLTGPVACAFEQCPRPPDLLCDDCSQLRTPIVWPKIQPAGTGGDPSLVAQ